MTDSTIFYTHTDEAPALATASFLPIVQAITSQAGVDVETRDISLAGRVLAAFPQKLTPEQQVGDALAELGGLATLPEANIIKLPNISASIPQLKAAIAELQSQGFDIPDYPDEAQSLEEKDIRARYDRIKGSAVNPVLREGNSDRRAPLSVKNYARKHPHRNKPFAEGSKTRVATIGHDDFKSNEKSVVIASDDVLTIQHVAADGTVTALKTGLKVLPGEIVDATFLSAAALDAFLAETLREAAADDVLYSVHLKATMMKVSDPIIFGHVVKAYFADVFDKYGDKIAEAGLTPNDGLGAILAGLPSVEGGDEIAAAHHGRPRARSAPLVHELRQGHHEPARPLRRHRGCLDARAHPQRRQAVGRRRRRGRHARRHPRLVVRERLPDGHRRRDRARSAGPRHDRLGAQRRAHGAGGRGVRQPRQDLRDRLGGRRSGARQAGDVLLEHPVQPGDIWRATQTKDIAIRDWVKLAVTRARATGAPAVFWLDETRSHDAALIAKVKTYLADHDTDGLTIEILAPAAATQYSLDRLRQGQDTISVTGNVLRDYLTDLFPILEVGTSAKMLSIVPLLAGGGLFETGAGGSAPKHVQQLLEENYLRWDSLGEFFALAASLEHLATFTGNVKAQVLADTLDAATGTFLENDKSPGRALGTIDNRGSHFYLALYWAQELAAQQADPELAAAFAPVADALASREQEIVAELLAVQGSPVDIGGYYRPDDQLVEAVMRPSKTLNEIVDGLG